ncbi:MAG: AAA family ATPase, partial [Limnohabitans sp.]|nr:AAA family ATPase [Limnohabitans sp.]
MYESTRNIQSDLKALRLNGMSGAWAELMEQDGGATIESSRWLIEH